MQTRNKVFAIESIAVMLVLLIFALVVFLVISSGSQAYGTILDDKQNTESARVAYSYINMKIKQNDSAGNINVLDTEFGSTLKIDYEDAEYCTYIFYADGGLYECLTAQDVPPSVDAANLITKISGFSISRNGALLHIRCICESGDNREIMEGMVGIRT